MSDQDQACGDAPALRIGSRVRVVRVDSPFPQPLVAARVGQVGRVIRYDRKANDYLVCFGHTNYMNTVWCRASEVEVVSGG